MKPHEPKISHPIVTTDESTPTPETGAGEGFQRQIALDFPIGDGRVGRCQVRLFQAAETSIFGSAGNPATAREESLVVALVEAPPGGSGFHLALYAGAIADALCARERLAPDRLLYIDHDLEAGARMSERAMLLGPQALYAYTAMVSQGSLASDTFHLVAFDFEAGALVRPRFTPLSRLDVETFIGGSFDP